MQAIVNRFRVNAFILQLGNFDTHFIVRNGTYSRRVKKKNHQLTVWKTIRLSSIERMIRTEHIDNKSENLSIKMYYTQSIPENK